MDLTKYFDRFQRLHGLICKKATGSPAELGDKLGLSERAVFEYIRTMRELGGPIAFCSIRQTYYYERAVTFSMGFQLPNEEEPVQIDS
jgi:predicted DNA-binding transcriptional regulator YafY